MHTEKKKIVGSWNDVLWGSLFKAHKAMHNEPTILQNYFARITVPTCTKCSIKIDVTPILYTKMYVCVHEI